MHTIRTILPAALLVLAAQLAGAAIVTDLETGRRQATVENKPLILEFSAKW